MCADVDCRKRNRSVPSRRCSISLIHARKTASVATMANVLSARALILLSVFAAISVLDFVRETKGDCSQNPRTKSLTTLAGLTIFAALWIDSPKSNVMKAAPGQLTSKGEQMKLK